jgi:hypothetical protein
MRTAIVRERGGIYLLFADVVVPSSDARAWAPSCWRGAGRPMDGLSGPSGRTPSAPAQQAGASSDLGGNREKMGSNSCSPAGFTR